MSRIAKAPVAIPAGIDVKLSDQEISVKGPNGQLRLVPHPLVQVDRDGDELKVSPRDQNRAAMAMAGTTRALVNNMVTGVSEGFEKKLSIVGVGYRAQVQGQKLNLTLGFSHPVVYQVPDGVTVETPSQTDIVVRGADKQRVGQVAAEIRSYRPPEPYKGKGVRYVDERVVTKQAKKK
ncbi:MAG: 50S ribosomal protein L6 [Gammaproteobacteria bacterium]|nr:50S ribosomal protein L6 [Gammaproteobacteria bacterium]